MKVGQVSIASTQELSWERSVVTRREHLEVSVPQVADRRNGVLERDVGGWRGDLYLLAPSLFNCPHFSICAKAYFLSVKKIGRGQGSVPPAQIK